MRANTLRLKWLSLIGLVSVLSACGGGGPVFPGALQGDTFALTNLNRLISFDRDDPGRVLRSQFITGLDANEAVLGIDIRPSDGRIYGLTSLGRVVVLDPETAAGVVVASLSADASDNSNPFSGLNGFRFGIDFNPVPDRMRVVSNNAQNLRINVDNGATVTDGSLRLGNPFAFNVTAVAYSDNFSATCRTTTYYLDTGNDQLLSSGAPQRRSAFKCGAAGH